LARHLEEVLARVLGALLAEEGGVRLAARREHRRLGQVRGHRRIAALARAVGLAVGRRRRRRGGGPGGRLLGGGASLDHADPREPTATDRVSSSTSQGTREQCGPAVGRGPARRWADYPSRDRSALGDVWC